MRHRNRDRALSGIGKRMRRRRLQALRDRRSLERESATSHDRHLRFLAELCGKLECGHFDPEEISAARAALLDDTPGSPQGVLALRRTTHA